MSNLAGRCRRASRRCLLVVFIGVVVLTAAGATARTRRTHPAPRIVLRFEGYVDHAPPGTVTEANIHLRHGKRTRPCVLRKLTALTQPITASDVLRAAAPWRSTFILRRPEDIIGALDRAPAGTGLEITGAWRRSSMDLLVDRIVPLEERR